MQYRHFKRLFLVLFTIFIFWMGAKLYYHLTDDFRLASITYDIPFETDWTPVTLNQQEQQQLSKIFQQTFYYYRKGAQCFVFLSEDQKYVLKFFKFKHLRPHILTKWIPSIPPFRNFKELSEEKKKNKLLRVFDGFDLVYRMNREESGLLYLQLKPVSYLHQQVTIIDKLGIKRLIDLDTVPFLVQKKGETLRTRLTRQLHSQQLAEVKRSIAAVLDMYVANYRKGLWDKDPGVMHNTGFLDEQPFHLDIGKFIYHAQIHQVEFYKQDLERIIAKIDLWLKINDPKNYPEMATFLIKEYERLTGNL